MIFGIDAKQLRALRWRQAALVFQSAMHGLHPLLRIENQLLDVLRAHGEHSRGRANQCTDELLDLVGLPRTARRLYPHELSEDKRQRVVLAIALALRPPLLILDEPTTALDVLVQREIMDRLALLRRELGVAMLFITHDVALMLEYCDIIGVLYAGRLAEIAPAREFAQSLLHPYSRGSLRASPTSAPHRQRSRGFQVPHLTFKKPFSRLCFCTALFVPRRRVPKRSSPPNGASRCKSQYCLPSVCARDRSK